MGSNRRDTGERTEAVSCGQEIFTECQLRARHTVLGMPGSRHRLDMFLGLV